ncbi:coiled-coil domain-containing protein 15 isoform X2 [Ochotona curzoniae]|uniref:coiled-coil domain-containing protein 15 isoform X2 n=1 Tax=Ochotona curzoniae TaxID=130825 RepID=UPI001B34CA12|nr:coiled-coil domain-containing protein 15 isoform X2 [Ochotona curzoniae]
MPGNMAPLKKPPDATRLPLALNPRKSKAILAVLAERNQAVVPVGAWVEPAVPDSSDIPAYTSARVIEEELKEKLRKKQEALKRFQRQVKHRVNQQIRLRKKQQLLKSREVAEKEGSMAMQSSHPACFTPKSTSIFPKHLNAVVGSPGLVPSQVLGDGLQDAENGSELFQQQAQALHQNMKLAHQRLASFKTVPIKKTSVFPDGKRKNILTQEELDHEEVSSVKTNEEGREDLFQVDQQEFVSEDKDVSCSRVQKVKFKNVMMEQEEQIELHPQSFHHIPQDQDHQETKGGLPESQSDLKEVHSVDLEAQDGEPLTQAVDLGIQAVELKKQTIPLEGQIVQTDTQSNMLEAQSVGLEDVSIELQTQNFLPSNQTFLAKDQSILPVHHDQNFLFEDQDILPNCQNQDFPSRGLCVFPKNQNILLKCQNQDFLPKDQSVFSKDQAILPSCADQEFLPGDPCVLLKDQNILLDCQEQNFLPKDDHVPFRKQKLPPKWQVQDFLPKDQNFLSGDQHFLPTNQNIPSKYLDQNFLPKDWSILPKDYQVLPSHQNFLSGDHRVIHNTQNIPSKYQVHCKETNPDVADEKGREDFSLKDYQCQPPKLQFQDLLRDPSLSFRVQVSVETAERWRDDLLLNSHQHPPRRPQRDASHRKKVCNNCQSRWESRAPLAFRPGVDQEEDKKERQRQYLRHRRLFMDIEREQVKEQKRQKEQKKKIEKIKKKREQERYAEEQRLLKMDLHREPCPEEKVTETLGQLQLGEKKEAREKQLQREKEDLRYVEALRAQVQEKMQLYKITLPPLCSCGPDFWDAHPDTCANSCVFYKNHRAYHRALRSVISSRDTSEGNSALRIAIHNFVSAHKRTLKNL